RSTFPESPSMTRRASSTAGIFHLALGTSSEWRQWMPHGPEVAVNGALDVALLHEVGHCDVFAHGLRRPRRTAASRSLLSCLLAPQGHNGIDSRCPTRGKISGEQGYCKQQDSGSPRRHRVPRLNAKK